VQPSRDRTHQEDCSTRKSAIGETWRAALVDPAVALRSE
jgi:hypothetical protein